MDIMIDNAEIVSISKTEWDEIVPNFPDYNFEQSSDYALAIAKAVNGRVEFLAVRTSKTWLGGACVRVKEVPGFKRGVAYITGGVLTCRRYGEISFTDLHKAVLNKIAAYLKEQKHYAILREPISSGTLPDIHKNYSGAGFQETDYARRYRTILININQNLDDIKKGFAAKWRRDLNSSHKSNLTLEVGSSPEFQKRFMSVYEAMVDNKELKLALGPEKFFDIQSEALGLQILIATKDGEDAAVHLLSCLNDTAVYLFGATNDIGRTTKAGYWIQWQAIITAKDLGCSWYDLGGIDPETNPGGFRFKSRMGGADVTAPGPFAAPPKGILGFALDQVLWWKHRKNRT